MPGIHFPDAETRLLEKWKTCLCWCFFQEHRCEAWHIAAHSYWLVDQPVLIKFNQRLQCATIGNLVQVRAVPWGCWNLNSGDSFSWNFKFHSWKFRLISFWHVSLLWINVCVCCLVWVFNCPWVKVLDPDACANARRGPCQNVTVVEHAWSTHVCLWWRPASNQFWCLTCQNSNCKFLKLLLSLMFAQFTFWISNPMPPATCKGSLSVPGPRRPVPRKVGTMLAVIADHSTTPTVPFWNMECACVMKTWQEPEDCKGVALSLSSLIDCFKWHHSFIIISPSKTGTLLLIHYYQGVGVAMPFEKRFGHLCNVQAFIM